MIALLKIAALLLVAVMALASSADARALLDYDGCYNRWRAWNFVTGDFYCDGHRWDRGGNWYGNDGRSHYGRDGYGR
ncbi:hypothetical protein CVIRNUC_003897 [Coccomyxa viridis]|uniref:Uncharacterized protein n=1 Tax=Coccomyxa viridis TaxID=1274662 RepID=A0AAV1I145_9CHLO|nr:hypothetical protein CVIRNUC_003897 [Coccomyxa viridis]